ncbi:MAG: insulinase family protein [Sphingomonadaceae bacterium]|nr:insulinase family protein [Sphingomonadaceae bacterium]
MKLRLPALALAAALLLGAPGLAQHRPAQPAPAPAAAPWPQTGSDVPVDPDVRFGTLPNGMRYVLRHNATPPHQVSLRLRIDAGSLEEQDDQRGLAHFIEHMAFNGSTHVAEGEFVHRLERLGLRFGADTNAGTEFGQTVYKLDLPENQAASIDEGLFLLREVAGEVSFAPAAIERERGIIQSEERSRAGPQYRIFVDQMNYLLRGQRLPTRLPIGVPEVIATAQRARFAAFYDAYYRPERATLVAVGDFDLDAMEAKIRARFSDWHGRGAAGPDPDLGAVAPRRTETHVLVEPGGPAQVALIWVRPPDLRPDTRAHRLEQLADALAFQVLNRRLERIAANRTPPPYVGASSGRFQLARSADIVQLGAVVQPGQWQPALAAIETEERRLVEHGVTAAELNRELDQIRTALNAAVAGAATRQTVSLADGLVSAIDQENVADSPADTLRLFDAAVPSLTPERINQSARTVFAGEPILYMTSPTQVEGGEGALLTAYRASLAVPVPAAAAEQAQAWPYVNFGTPGTVAERHELPADIGGTAIRFTNGVRLTVKRTDYAASQVLVAVRFGRGQAALPTNRPNPGWALGPSLAAGGLGRLTFEQMQEALNNRVYGASLGIDEDAFTFAGTTRPEDLAVQLQVLAAYVTDPGWRPTGWNRLRALSDTIHDQLASTPSGVFNRDSGPLLHGGDNRWALPTREQMAASTIADARAVLDAPLAHSPIEVIVVGDIDVDAAIRQVAATFGALPPRSEAPAPPEQIRFPAGRAEPVRLTHRGRADQGLAFIGWPTLGFYDNPRQARALSLLAAVYQLRLTQKIREEQGTTYSPAGYHRPSEAFPGYGMFAGQIEARPEALAGFLRDAERIAADLRDRPIAADEMQRARLPLVEGLQRARNGNAWWLDSLEGIQTNRQVAPTIESQISDYDSLTPAELQEAARRYLVPGRAWKLIIVPETAANAPAAAPAAH